MVVHLLDHVVEICMICKHRPFGMKAFEYETVQSKTVKREGVKEKCKFRIMNHCIFV